MPMTDVRPGRVSMRGALQQQAPVRDYGALHADKIGHKACSMSSDAECAHVYPTICKQPIYWNEVEMALRELCAELFELMVGDFGCIVAGAICKQFGKMADTTPIADESCFRATCPPGTPWADQKRRAERQKQAALKPAPPNMKVGILKGCFPYEWNQQMNVATISPLGPESSRNDAASWSGINVLLCGFRGPTLEECTEPAQSFGGTLAASLER